MFGLSVKEKAKATLIIRTTVEAGLIKVMDPSVIAPIVNDINNCA